MSPQDWGWKESEGALIPVTTYLDPAPNKLLRIVRCKLPNRLQYAEVLLQEAWTKLFGRLWKLSGIRVLQFKS